jgi:hypothetical protein
MLPLWNSLAAERLVTCASDASAFICVHLRFHFFLRTGSNGARRLTPAASGVDPRASARKI